MSHATPPRITRLIAKNYKSLGDVDVRFEPLTIFVGPNAAGKSNTLSALRFIRDALATDLRQAFERRGGFEVVMNDRPTGTKPAIELGVELEIGGRRYAYGFFCRLEPTGLPVIAGESFSSLDDKEPGLLDFIREGDKWLVSPRMLKQPPRVHPGSLALPLLATLEDAATPVALRFLQEMKFFGIVPDLVRGPQRGHQKTLELLSEDGHNLGPALLSLRFTRPGDFDAGVMEPLTAVLPGVRDVAFEQAGAYVVTKLVREGAPSAMLDLSSESYGTLRLLGNLAALRQASPPVSLVAIEEPENALHPAASQVLAEAIIEAASGRQVVITTHSPDLLDSFSDRGIRVVENVDGITRIGELEASQRQAIRERLFHPGEIMRMEGLHRAEAAGSDA